MDIVAAASKGPTQLLSVHAPAVGPRDRRIDRRVEYLHSEPSTV